MSATIQPRICRLLTLGLLAASAAARFFAYPTIVSDYTAFFARWLSALAHAPGLSALATPFSNYPPLYLYLFKLLTAVPINGLYGIKTLSLVFEVVIAAAAAWMVGKSAPRAYSRRELFLIFAVMLSIPTLLINGSLWGQVDSLYAAFVLLSLLALVQKRPLAAAILYGVALSFKVQAIFFLPVFLGYLLRDIRRFAYVLILPAVYVISVMPAWLAGASLPYLLTVYLRQADQYPSLSLNSPSVFAFTQGLQIPPLPQGLLSWAGIAAAATYASYIAYRIMRFPPADAASWLYFTLLSVVAIPYFLPHMHERYFYLADMFSVIYAFYVPRHWYIPILVVPSSLIAYSAFLSREVAWFGTAYKYADLRHASLLMLLALLALVIRLPQPVPQPQRSRSPLAK
jgi:Gpi18-like mannosyltransferase